MKRTTRKILISNRCKALRVRLPEIRNVLRVLDRKDAFPLPPGEISVVFLDDATMGELHGTFLGDPNPTDVITFPGDPELDEGGEICVGAERAYHTHGSMDQSFARELVLYLAHGWLHLAGYDDRSDSNRSAMREAEQDALDRIEAAGPLPDAVFEPLGES